MAKLSKATIIGRNLLERLGDARLVEARALRDQKCYGGAIYLAGYSVECWLKVAICSLLDTDELPETFLTHDLDLLLFHSGLNHKIRSEKAVHDSFREVFGIWQMDKRSAIRYKDPQSFSKADADQFLEWVSGNQGVVTWVRLQI